MTIFNLKTISLLVTLVLSCNAIAQYKIELLDTNTFTLGEGVVLSKTSFRGLSVVDDQTIWVSGSRGTVARSVNGGKTFVYSQLKGYEKSDFRDIEAFDTKRAIIMSSGTPAYILKTTDGGLSWKEVYKNTDTAYFLDAMDFWDDKKGVLIGDPINGHFVLLYTLDGGDNWMEGSKIAPVAESGEAVFAASGTSLRFVTEAQFQFVTGGSCSNLYTGFIDTVEIAFTLSKSNVNLKSGKSTTGAFSFVSYENEGWRSVVVGGDFTEPSSTDSVSSVYIYNNEIQTFAFKVDKFEGVKGYRSCIETVKKGKLLIAAGITGVDIGTNGWRNISQESFHVVRKAKKGKAVFLAGPKGKIGKLVY